MERGNKNRLLEVYFGVCCIAKKIQEFLLPCWLVMSSYDFIQKLGINIYKMLFYTVHTISLMMAKTIYHFGTHPLCGIFLLHKNIPSIYRYRSNCATRVCVFFDAFEVFVIFYKIDTNVGL